MAKNPRLIELTDRRFGRWLVLEQSGNDRQGGALWRCRCDCGVERVVRGGDLRWGGSQSCGCVGEGRLGALRRTHGEAGTRLYCAWQNMRSRCLNPKNRRYDYWGGRGITICAEWSDFSVFRDWAAANGYADNLTLERKDVNGNYEPDNCTWATRAAQAANRRFNLRAPDGELWLHKARRNGIPGYSFRNRIFDGWPPETAATLPPRTLRVDRDRDRLGRFA